MDGSAAPFVAAIDQVGIVTQNAPRRCIEVLKPVRVVKGDGVGELRPYSHGFRVEAEIEFSNQLIGKQSFALDIDPASFRRELSRARTFGFMRDVATLWNAGYALGASFENTLVVTDDRVLNPTGLRYLGRVRAPQGARRARRPRARRCAAARLLSQLKAAATASITRCCRP